MALTALLLIASPVLAAKWVDSQKADFYTVPDGNSDNVSDILAGGQVTLVDPMGNVSLIIQGNVRDLTPSTTYAVWVRNLAGYTGDYLNNYEPLGYFMLTTFTTNAKGHGNFHINIGKDDLPDGTYDIQVAINDLPSDQHPNGVTKIATQKYTVVTVKGE